MGRGFNERIVKSNFISKLRFRNSTFGFDLHRVLINKNNR